MNAGLGVPYFTSISAVAAHYAWQLLTLSYDNPADCMAKFKSNWHIGALVFLGIEMDALSSKI